MSQKRSLGNDAATIAIVAMAGRFPGASDVGQFWQNLRNGVESIQRFSDGQQSWDFKVNDWFLRCVRELSR